MNGYHPVLYFTNSTLWGGVEEHICGLLRNLPRSLFRPHLVCAPATFERFRSACPGDVEITPLSLLGPTHVSAGAQLARLLLHGRFHIVHSHMFWSSLCASPIAWACRVPIIVETLHGSEAWRTGWKANYVIDRAITHFVSRYVAVCNSDAEFLVNKKHVPAEKITVIHNGVNIRRFATTPAHRRSARNALGLSEKDLVLIMVARFHPGKGHRVLLAAMRQLLHSFPKVKLICLGEGGGESDIRQLCEDFGLSHSVRLAGYQPNVQDWLMAADINVLPSFYEGLPLTILEAMASSLPTVATRVGGIPDAIEDGLSGLLVPPGNIPRLVEALSFLLRDAEARKRMGNVAYWRAAQSFRVESQISNTERMYLELCGASSLQHIRTIPPATLPATDDRYSSMHPDSKPDASCTTLS